MKSERDNRATNNLFAAATGRFAPSPTGPMHMGHLVTALSSYCSVKQKMGNWLIRIDDIDSDRRSTESANLIIETLRIHGMIPDTEVTYQGEYPITPSSNDDLIVQALNAVGLSMKVEVDKKIPPGGGLGGGSANAAAILRWANFKDEKKAVHLGSDVPFNIRGGRASVSGVGESVTYLPYEEKTFTLILPPFSCSTADVYKRLSLIHI